MCLKNDSKWDGKNRGRKMSDCRPVVTGNIQPVEPLTSSVLWPNSPIQGDQKHLHSVVGLSWSCTDRNHREA